MSVEGSLSPQSSTDSCVKEEGCNPETQGVPEWSLNSRTYQSLQKGHCIYNAEEQSLVWPPMLLMCIPGDSSDIVDKIFIWARNQLAIDGVQTNNVAETKHVCCEGNTSCHLLVLPPSGMSFAAAKAVDSAHGNIIFYPSLKDMIDIKNGRVPEFSRCHVKGLKYHGRPRQAWINLVVDLVRDDGLCVGRGVCEKFEPTDYVDEKLLGKYHVGVRVLEVVDALLPAHWMGSLHRWRMTHVLYNGVSLFECLRQHLKQESEDFFYKDGRDCASIAQAEGVLRDQSISSVTSSIGICKDLNVNFDHLSPTYSKTCRDFIDAIEKNTFKSDNERPSQYGGKCFATKFESDESLRRSEIDKIVNDISKRRNWMECLGATNSSHLARDVVKRLTVLQKLTESRSSSTLISSMMQDAEECEFSILHVIAEKVERDKPERLSMADFGSEIERFILRRRNEQHKNLLKEVTNIKDRHLSTLDAYVLDKFKFVGEIGRRRNKSEGVDQWLSHHTAEATNKEKRKWEEKVAKARKEEQKKWEEEVEKVRLEEQKKKEEEVAKARTEEKKKWEEESAKVMTELAVARQELSDQKEAMPKCAICFEGLEGIVATCG